MRKRLQKIFLLGTFLSMFLGILGAEVNWNNGNVIMNATTPGSVWDDTLNLSGTITISQDVYIGAHLQDTVVNVTSNNVILQPASDISGVTNTGKAWGHLIFYADLDREIIVNVDYDLVFQGVYTNTTDFIVTFSGQGQTTFKLSDYYPNDATRGCNVEFTGFGFGLPYTPNGENCGIFHGGTRVYILMDQTETQALQEGRNKVVFQRENYYDSVGDDYPHSGKSTGVKVGPASFITYLSTNSTGFKLDTYANGDYGTLAFDPTAAQYANDSRKNQGRLFLEIQGDPQYDPTTQQTRVNGQYNFHDGGVVVCGNFVDFFEEEYIRNRVFLNRTAGRRAIFRVIDGQAYSVAADDYDPNEDDRRGLLIINKNSTVPILAADQYLTNAPVLNGGAGYLSGSAPLVSSNHPLKNFQGGHYWAYYYAWEYAPYNYWANQTMWPQAPGAPVAFNVRTGFVLGTNGWTEVYHNTFIDHVACNYGELEYFAVEDWSDYVWDDYSLWDTGSPAFKWRNPAAFVVDGLNHYSNNYPEGFSPYSYNKYPTTDGRFDPTLNAHMIFYGNGAAYFRCAADKDGVVLSPGPDDTSADPTYPRYEYRFYIDRQAYDGNYIPSIYTSAGEGEGVLDIEGKLNIYGRARGVAPGRYNLVTMATKYAPLAIGQTEKGEIGMPTLNLDFKGLEFGWNATVDRPLVQNRTYDILNSPSVLINRYSTEFNNMIFKHTDVVKNMTTNPQWAPPAMVGGELLAFINYIDTVAGETIANVVASDGSLFEWSDYPKFRFYNSELQMHESLVASGFRFVAKEIEYVTNENNSASNVFPYSPGSYDNVYGSDANSDSVFRYYDHGDKIDTILKGYGRQFMAGCGYNYMSAADQYTNNVYTNQFTESCFVNVYRGKKVSAPNTPAISIRLGVEAADDNDNPNVLKTELVNSDEYGWNRATHLFLLSRHDDNGKSFMSLGWTNTFGHDFYYPWEGAALVTRGTDHFDIGADSVTPATFSVDGNFVYFGGTDWNNNKAVVPVIGADKGSVIYTNHGGRFTATQPQFPVGTEYAGELEPSEHGYDCFADTVLAYRLWGTEPLYGIIDVPKDQIVYGHGFGRQPYDINTTASSSYFPEEGRYGLRVRTYNSESVVTPDRQDALNNRYRKYYFRDLHSGEEVVIPWGVNSHTYDASFWPSPAAKSIVPTRYTASITEGPGFPDKGLLYFGAGDYVTQLKISGATMSDPINMLVSGNAGAPGFAQIREIVSIPTNPAIWGEGAHAIIFMNHSGRIGLGDRDWNQHSPNAWSLLGKDYVTIAADGDCAVDVNSNLLVTDNGAIVATTMFGADPVEYPSVDKRETLDDGPRLTFFSEETREIRVPRGVELDLSTFAKQLGTDPQQQIVEIGGRLRLIFEPGSTLRFPHIRRIDGDTTPRPILYLNDEAELIFEEDLEESKGRHMDIRSTDSSKTLILGHGEIWINKDAKMVVNDGAKVAVQSDPRTPTTDIKISIQRQGEFVIGTETNAGGSFEVGNPVDMDTYYDESTQPYHPINFELVLNGPKARFHIDREGFFGLGVGIVNKDGVPNGDADSLLNPDSLGNWNPSTKAWEVAALYNVHNVSINVTRGIFDHSNIYDGNVKRASLMAVGPVYPYEELEGEFEVLKQGKYEFIIANPVKSRVLGGGNIMRIAPKDLEYPGKAYVNIWDYKDVNTSTAYNRSDGTMYAIMSSAPILLQWISGDFAVGSVTSLATANGQGGYFQSATSIQDLEFFKYISGKDYVDLDTKMVNIGATEFESTIGYANTPDPDKYAFGSQIYRRSDIQLYGDGIPEDGLPFGILGATGVDLPEFLWAINRRG